jgi:hypothetical protein
MAFNATSISGRLFKSYGILCACVLWLTRVVLQLIRPQGSMSPILQYAMLSAFVLVFLCHAIDLDFTEEKPVI